MADRREGEPGETYAGVYQGRGLCVLDYTYVTSNGRPSRRTPSTWSVDGFAVPDVLARLDAMTRLIDLIPPFVLRDYGQPTFS
ncbi:hypothetical protein [Kribbella sp. C-35]|uniref:hypothetical protein n=1 Tax=Kribbella sp. C-35 TaxID=2789276 RepID=UPI00397E8648